MEERINMSDLFFRLNGLDLFISIKIIKLGFRIQDEKYIWHFHKLILN